MKRVVAVSVSRSCQRLPVTVPAQACGRVNISRHFSSSQVPVPNDSTVTFHTRPLPPSLIAMSSPAGKQLFREALSAGTMECFFPLSEQFITQSEPSYCSISSLVMILNALKFDPKKIWKSPWRWVSEETLQCESREICGHSLDKILQQGMNFNEFESLANCHGVGIKSVQVGEGVHDDDCRNSLASFRKAVLSSATSAASDHFLVVNYSRKVLKQTGQGHFSPIGGYHADKDLVLILDVARFKYPPYWVPIQSLWNAMAEKDTVSSQSRGYFIISTDSSNLNVSETDQRDIKKGIIHHNHNHSHGHSHTHSHTKNNHCNDQGEKATTSSCHSSHTHTHDHNHIVLAETANNASCCALASGLVRR